MKSLSELTESEVLALAIANEEEDSRIYQTFAGKLRDQLPASARVFDEMAEEERSHRASLYDAYRARFGEHLPPIRREDVRGFMKRRAVWMLDNLGPERMRREAEPGQPGDSTREPQPSAKLGHGCPPTYRGHGSPVSVLELLDG